MELPLKRYQEFQQILQDYHISTSAAEALSGLRLVLMVAPSSTGRNTIIRYLLKSGHYYYIVSDTTRIPRVNDNVAEQNGREYWFKSEEQVLAGLQAGEYLEAELIHNQQVSGISLAELLKAKQQGKSAITDIEIKGLHNIIKVKPDVLAVMLLPPSFDEWQRRMAQRGRMSQDEQTRRLQTAHLIFADGLEQPFYKFVIAENVEQSAAIIDALITGGPNPHQDRGRELLHILQAQLDSKLGLSGTLDL